MMTAMTRLTALLVLLSSAASAAPLGYTLPDETAQLRPGQGAAFEATQNNCVACHSADYIATQPPHRGAAFWQTEVAKMVKLYHAPIDDADAKLIVTYLAATY